MRRRNLLAGVGAALALGVAGGARGQGQVALSGDPEELVAAARDLAARPYAPVRPALSPPFDRLDYDSFRGVRPRPGRAAALGLGERFRADLLPPGWLFRDAVSLALPGHDTAFDPALFDFDPRYFPEPAPGPAAPGMGFSGLRLTTPLNRPGLWDEVLVIQGASYFRGLARATVYGLSARALALGTGGAAPEEFPVTRHISVFDVAGDRLGLGLLVDSPRASAALLATLEPGAETVMDCALHLFPRVAIADAGIAPLTSMFQHNDLGPGAIDDFRPAVHDSDLLVIDNGAGERLWRPLANPARVEMSAFGDDNPRGFGLVQGPADFQRFRDAEAAYHRRPTGWITPRGDWGRGAVMLLEIPTRDEFADNIVAFWRPTEPLQPGAHRFDYRLSWRVPGLADLPQPTGPLPYQPVRSASGIEPNARQGRLYVVDFVPSPGWGGSAPPVDALMLDLSAGQGGRLSGEAVYALAPEPGTIRTSFVFMPDAGAAVSELRLVLRRAIDGVPVSPVWLHRWTPARDGGV
jgi:periplasmic glucans biosynthesis protein